MMSGKFALLNIMNNEDRDIDSMTTIFNTAVSENSQRDPKQASSENKNKKTTTKKQTTWVTVEILELCDKRRQIRKKRFQPEGSEKYKKVTNNIKKFMKKAKENWIGERCSETEENLRKNNCDRAYQLVSDLTAVKQGKATTIPDRSGKCLTEEHEILNR